MREYLLASLKPRQWISFPHIDDDGEKGAFFAQVLAVEPKVTTVHTCQPQHFAKRSFLSVAVQPLERWLTLEDDASKLDHAEVFIFNDEQPQELNLQECYPHDRRQYLEWSAKASTIEGCSLLVDPRPLKPAELDLLDSRVPTLCLLDALQQRGWKSEARPRTHRPESELTFDGRRPIARKSYLRCLLTCVQLYEAGVEF